MDDLFTTFRTAYTSQNGYTLSSTLLPTFAPRLRALTTCTSPSSLPTDLRYQTIYAPSFPAPKPEAAAWLDVYTAYFRCVFTLVAAEELTADGRGAQARWADVYESWKEVVNALVKGYAGGHFAAWTVPCLYVGGKWARVFAMRADEAKALYGGGKATGEGMDPYGEEDVMAAGAEEAGKNDHLEDAARLINRIFSLCIGDRAPIEDSRKWALYNITNLLFATYFRLNSLSLCKTILRSLRASTTDMPPLSAFPKSHVVTFHYYVGVLHFLEEEYKAAEEELGEALRLCPTPLGAADGRGGTWASGGSRGTGKATSRIADRNRERILTYLIPTLLLTKRLLPSSTLLAPYPALQRLFGPLVACLKRGDLAGFDRALEDGAEVFVRKRVYLTLERGRELAVRNLFRKVFLVGGGEGEVRGAGVAGSDVTSVRGGTAGASDAGSTMEEGKRVRRTRIPVEEFRVALNLGNKLKLKHTQASNGNDVNMEGTNGSDSVAGDEEIDRDEAECWVANCVCKGLMKGYISRERAMVVLSKAGAFPGTGV